MQSSVLNRITEFFSPKTIYKTFFVLGLTITFVFSLLMPFFNEPDGQYHLAVSGRIGNTVIDTSRYGELDIISGMVSQQDSYKDGTRFEKYYLNRAKFISWQEAPREVNYSKFNFVYWGHVIPAIGLRLGRLIYPSMGVMITVARLFTSLMAIIALTLIIKSLKKGHLIYFAVFLSPVALNAFASLSYDATGFVIVAWLMALQINTLVDRQITKRRLIAFLLVTLLTLLGCKQNYWLLLLLIPVVLLNCDYPQAQAYRQQLSQYTAYVKSKWWLRLGILALLLAGFVIVTLPHGGPFIVIRRYLMTFGYNYAGTDLLSNDITSWLAAPYPSFNYIPTWVSAVWYLLIFAVLFSEEKFIASRSVGLTYLAFFFLGVFGVFFIMLDYNGARTSYIEGVQGRYFTPTLLTLQVFAASTASRLNQAARRLVPLFLLGLILVSNGLLLFDTVISLILR
ncbi:DUF2142 domain-containing protein [Streptococcus halichoeri]|uniref:DUF2142 domain-containing protein n=1 Tax=Streptococcus halichoeri TaxID=254785 RepID=UPI00135673B9|nr:DUF2142 domain-containing protein [Streptococcus halichoeri]